MKTKLYLVTVALLFSSVFTVKAQTLDSKYGLDSVKTVLNASLYSEMVKQKNYKEALPNWRYVFNNAPHFQKSTYKNGVTIMRYMFKTTKDQAYLDTLMMVYDQRIKYFGNSKKYGKNWILGRKGGDLFKYKQNDLTAIKEAYNIMMESVKLGGNKVEAAVMDKIMEAAKMLVKENELPKEEVVDVYLKFMEITTAQLKIYPKKVENINAARQNIENNFFATGVADCKTLASIFTPKFNANLDDMVLIDKILKLLNRQACEEEELYARVAEKKYKMEPTADAAHTLAKMFIKKKDFVKTKRYLTQSIDLQKDPEIKAELYYKLANIYLSESQYRKTKECALKAIEKNPKWGKPYIVIGKAYAAYSKKYGQKPFEHLTVYWVAVDKFAKAKNVDSECAEEASRLIETYSQYFPRKEDAFFEGFKNGDSYKIGDWINETTKVRVND